MAANTDMSVAQLNDLLTEFIGSVAKMTPEDIIGQVTAAVGVVEKNTGKSMKDIVTEGEPLKMESFLTTEQVAEWKKSGVDFDAENKQAAAVRTQLTEQFAKIATAPEQSSDPVPGKIGRAQTMGPEDDDVNKFVFSEEKLQAAFKDMMLTTGTDVPAVKPEDAVTAITAFGSQAEEAIKANPNGAMAQFSSHGQKALSALQGAFEPTDAAKAKAAIIKFNAASDAFVNKHAKNDLGTFNLPDFELSFPIIQGEQDKVLEAKEGVLSHCYNLLPTIAGTWKGNAIALIKLFDPEQAKDLAKASSTIDQYKSAVAAYNAAFLALTKQSI